MFRSFRWRISFTFFVAMSLVTSLAYVGLYHRILKDQTGILRNHLENTAELAASFLSGDDVLKVDTGKDCKKDPQRIRMIQELKKVTKIDPRIDDAYVMIPGDRQNIFRFVANANQEVSPTGCGEPYDASHSQEMLNALSAPGVEKQAIKDRWGSWLSGYAPIYDSQGKAVAFLGLDVAERTIQQLQRAFLERFAWAMIATIFLAFLVGFWSSGWLTKPLDRIVSGMERVSKGDMDYHLQNIPQLEFDKIVNIFNRMTASLKKIMHDFAENVKQTERLDREMELAADIQKMALPAFPPLQEYVDIAARSLPAKEVGGDYFDFLIADKGKIGFVIADAAGKGFPGSLYMTNSRSVFRVVSTEEKMPQEVLRRTNNFISNEASATRGMFITFLYSVYEKETKKFTYSNAGHYPPLVFNARERKFRSLDCGGIPLGLYPEQSYPQETVQLETGDTVVMYTDGLIEALNGDGDMFGLPRLMEIIEKKSAHGASAMLHEIENEMNRFVGVTPPFDDMTLVVFKVK